MLTIEKCGVLGNLDYDLETCELIYTPYGSRSSVRLMPLIHGVEGDQGRLTRVFSGTKDRRTQMCFYALLRRTNVHRLMDIADGDKWVIKRAIAMYNRCLYFPVVDSEYHPRFGVWRHPLCTT